MLNVNMLKAKLIEKGISISEISMKLGMHPTTFSRKMRNKSFTIKEMALIVQILHLSAQEANDIFFSQTVA